MHVSTSYSGRSAGSREADAVGGDDRHVKRRRRDRRAPGCRLPRRAAGGAAARRTRSPRRTCRRCRSTSPPTPNRAAAQRGTPDERDESAGVPVELVERQRAFPFRRPQLHPRHQAAEIAVALRATRSRTGRHERRDRRAGGVATSAIGRLDRQLGADDRLESRALRGEMESRRAVDAVAIEQRERRIAERGGAVDQRFGQRRAVEKGKRGGGVQLDVHGRLIGPSIEDAVEEPRLGRCRS